MASPSCKANYSANSVASLYELREPLGVACPIYRNGSENNKSGRINLSKIVRYVYKSKDVLTRMSVYIIM